MKRNNTLLLVSLGVLSLLSIYLLKSGWNTNTQVLEEQETSESVSTTPENPSTEGHQHINANAYLRNLINLDDTTTKGQVIDAFLSEDRSMADILAMKNLCSESDTSILALCNTLIHQNNKNWTQFDQSLITFSRSSLEEDFVMHQMEPILVDANEQNAKPLYLNMLSDIMLHDQGNMTRFMGGIRMLKQVLDLDSNDEKAIYKLAIFSIRSNQLEKAKQRFKKLISLQPENEAYRNALLQLCEQTNDSACLSEYKKD